MVFVALFSSCNPCSRLDCNSDNYSVRFKIKGSATGHDLIFGNNRIFDFAKLKCYSINGLDSTFYKIKKEPSGISFTDSLIQIEFYPATSNPVYLQLSQNDQDTLLNQFKSYTSKCCGVITDISQIKYNNTTVFNGGYETVEIRK